MPVSRQIRYLRRTRENWKQNAAEKREIIQEYEQIIRSLKNRAGIDNNYLLKILTTALA